MKARITLLIAILLAFSPALVTSQESYCCVDRQNEFCTGITPDQESSCQGDVIEDSCNNVPECATGCCCDLEDNISVGGQVRPQANLSCSDSYTFVTEYQDEPIDSNMDCTQICSDVQRETDQTGGTGPTEPTPTDEQICTAAEDTQELILDQPEEVGDGIIRLEWNLNPGCEQARVEYYIHRRNQSETTTEIVGNTTATYFEDTTVEYDTTYAYNITAVFPDQTEVTSSEQTITVSSILCNGREGETICHDNDIVQCGPNGAVQSRNSCDSSVCIETSQGASCKTPADCDQCNQAYGMYPDPSREVEYEGSSTDLTCYQLQQDRLCYRDNSSTVVDPYKSCPVRGCMDYESRQTCLGDPCGTNLPCEWKTPYGESASQNLGIGKCVNENAENLGSLCGSGDEECTQDTCESLGNCYFQAEDNTCVCEGSATCKDYGDDRTACTGGQSVEVNAQYDDRTRVGGNHIVEQRSNDALGLGKCEYRSGGIGCVKNADNLQTETGSVERGDCGDNNDKCLTDFENPTTTLLLNSDGVIGWDEGIDYGVRDNAYNAENIKTYYCFSRGTCYPQTQAGNQILLDLTGVGKTNITYYSEDPAHNLEVLNVETVNYDTNRPSIDLTYTSTMSTASDNAQLDININVNDETTPISCNWELNGEGTTRTGSGTGDTYSLSYQVPPEIYTFNVECYDGARNSHGISRSLVVESDGRITNIQPRTTFSQASEITMSATTESPGTCRYSPTTHIYDAMTNEFSTTGATEHTNPAPSEVSGTGIYEYNIACSLNDGSVIVEQNPDDVVRFVIDQIPPETRITGLNREMQEGAVQSATITLECNDRSSDLVDDNERDWNFGCHQLYTCKGEGCNPTATGANRTRMTFNTDGTEMVRYYSEDQGGNTEEIQNFTVTVDTTNPAFEEARIIAPPEYFDPERELKVTGATTGRITGTISVDATQICALNERNNEERCVGTCTGRGNNCIRGDGQFTMPFNIAGDNNETMNDVTITATDWAGNNIETTLQLLYDGVAPDDPTYTLENEE